MRSPGIRTCWTGLIAFVLASLPAFAETENSLLASMRRAGEAKVPMASAPPWTIVLPSGEAKGYSVEIVDMVLKGMGAPAQAPILSTWDAMIPGLQARRFDFVPTLTITEARCKTVIFSAPTFAMQDALYVPAGNVRRLRAIAQFAQIPDLKLAVLAGSTQEQFAIKHGVKLDQLVRVPDIQAGVSSVTGGRAAAFALGQFSIGNPEQKGLDVVVDKQTPVNAAAVAFRREDLQFRDAFNKQLNFLRANGAMRDLALKSGIPNWDTLATLTKASDLVPSCE